MEFTLEFTVSDIQLKKIVAALNDYGEHGLADMIWDNKEEVDDEEEYL